MNNRFNNNSPTFSSRCVQIKDAQWVCRKVRSIPHLSTTKIGATMLDLEIENPQSYDKFVNKHPFEPLVANSKKEAWLFKMFGWYRRIITKMSHARENCRFGKKDNLHLVENVIQQLKTEGFGNCGEDALLSAAILNINGAKSYTARMKVDDLLIDHLVCIFNKDSSVFDGKITNKTIIIDSWLDDVDFASNMFVKYKSLYKKYFSIKRKSKIDFCDIKPVELSGSEQLLLLMKHEGLCFPSLNRGFMQK